MLFRDYIYADATPLVLAFRARLPCSSSLCGLEDEMVEYVLNLFSRTRQVCTLQAYYAKVFFQDETSA